MPAPTTPQNILDFWYSKEMQGRWFSSTPALDDEIRDKFKALWRGAVTTPEEIEYLASREAFLG